MNKLLFLSFLFVTLIQSEIMQFFNDHKVQLTQQNQSKDEDKGNYSKMPENGEAVNPAGKVKGWMKKLSHSKKSNKRGANPGGKFRGWMKKYRRNYRPQEQNLRFEVFNKNQILVEDHNNAKNSKFVMGLNKFADLTDKQFQYIYLSKILPQLKLSSIAPPPLSQDSQDNNSSTRLLQSTGIDWRNQIKFAPIKDQGSCAACYAFANIGALELNWALKHGGVQPSLSEQQIVDCCGTAGFKCTGCVSGGLGQTYQFLAKYGVQTSSSYPYAGLAQNCNLGGLSGKNYLRKDRPYFQFSGVRNTINYLTRGPVAVAADATTWKFYTSGTFDRCPRSKFNYTHACVIIGINQDGSWIIRNSWGADWGMQGYITLQAGNSCGITNYVYFPFAS